MKRLGLFTVSSLGFLLFVGCAKETVRRDSYAPNQKWEYKVVKIDKGDERDFTTMFNVLAKEGWEFDGHFNAGERHLVFKRSVGPAPFAATRKASREEMS